MENKTYLPIDGKNILEDWIYEYFTSYADTSLNLCPKRSIVGRIDNGIVLAEWRMNGETVSFQVLKSFDEEKSVFIDELADTLRQNLSSEGQFVCPEIEVRGDTVYVSFFYDE